MNCDIFLSLLYEVPRSRWTAQQQASADSHCQACECCKKKLGEQQQLFDVFDQLTLPPPQADLAGQLDYPIPRQQKTSWPEGWWGVFSIATVLFLCAGSALQLFRESGFSWYWIADFRRLESLIELLYSSPLLSIALTLAGIVYCLGLTLTHQEADQ
jgi:hypothetical protein